MPALNVNNSNIEILKHEDNFMSLVC